MLVRGLIISGRLVQVRTTPKHRSTHISNYYLRLFRPVLFHKKIGLPSCTLFTITVTCSSQIILLPNYLLPTISVLADNTLLKITCHFLLLLVGFDTLTYERTTIEPLYLWVIKTLFWRRCRGVKRLW